MLERFSSKTRAMLVLGPIYFVIVLLDKTMIGAAVVGVFVQAEVAYLFLRGGHVTDAQLIVPPICALVIICAYAMRKTIRW